MFKKFFLVFFREFVHGFLQIFINISRNSFKKNLGGCLWVPSESHQESIKKKSSRGSFKKSSESSSKIAFEFSTGIPLEIFTKILSSILPVVFDRKFSADFFQKFQRFVQELIGIPPEFPAGIQTPITSGFPSCTPSEIYPVLSLRYFQVILQTVIYAFLQAVLHDFFSEIRPQMSPGKLS